MFLSDFEHMNDTTVERGPMYVSKVAKLSFGTISLENINKITVEKNPGCVISVGEICLLSNIPRHEQTHTGEFKALLWSPAGPPISSSAFTGETEEPL
jgi:hypothetical protein